MTERELIEAWLAQHHATNLPYVDPTPPKRTIRRGKFRAAKSLKPGGRLS